MLLVPYYFFFSPLSPFCLGEKKIMFRLKHGTQPPSFVMDMKNKCAEEMHLALCGSLKYKMQ